MSRRYTRLSGNTCSGPPPLDPCFLSVHSYSTPFSTFSSTCIIYNSSPILSSLLSSPHPSPILFSTLIISPRLLYFALRPSPPTPSTPLLRFHSNSPPSSICLLSTQLLPTSLLLITLIPSPLHHSHSFTSSSTPHRFPLIISSHLIPGAPILSHNYLPFPSPPQPPYSSSLLSCPHLLSPHLLISPLPTSSPPKPPLRPSPIFFLPHPGQCLVSRPPITGKLVVLWYLLHYGSMSNACLACFPQTRRSCDQCSAVTMISLCQERIPFRKTGKGRLRPRDAGGWQKAAADYRLIPDAVTASIINMPDVLAQKPPSGSSDTWLNSAWVRMGCCQRCASSQKC